MAKRLNRKVVLAGTAVLLVMFVVFLIAAQERDVFTSQMKLIEDGDAAVAEQDYETAKIKYLRARSRAKDDEVRLVALNRLVEVYLRTEDWPPLQGVWREIQNIEPDNVAVRYARLKYLYIVADGGARRLWQDIEKETSDFLEIVERNDLLNEDTAQWEKPEYKQVGLVHPSLSGSDGIQRIGQYLYLLRGRAKLEIASSGATTEPDRILDEAIGDLEKAQELDPTNTNVAWQLARTFMARGERLATRGSFDEVEKAEQLALDILKKACEISPQDVQGRINLLAIEQTIALAKDDSIETLVAFEPQHLALAEKFPQNPEVYFFIADYYRRMGPRYLDQTIEAIDKARELDPNNVIYAIGAADAYSFKAAIEDDKAALDKAITTLNSALSFPGAQETEGPQRFRYINNKASIYIYLGTIYMERLLDSEISLTPEQRQEWLGRAEEVVHEIEQILGSGEDPVVMKWQGMLALAKGDKTEAIEKLYAVYQRLKASNRIDTQLAYVLAKTFEDTTEVGAAREFFVSSLRLRMEDRGNRGDSVDRRKPSAVLDLSQILLKLAATQPALVMVNYYDNIYGANPRSRALKVSALSAAGDFEAAEAALAEGGLELPERLKLETQLIYRKISTAQVKVGRQRISEKTDTVPETTEPGQEPVNIDQLERQIKEDNDRLAENVVELVTLDPNLISAPVVVNTCRIYQNQGKEDKARELTNLFLRAYPEDILVRTYLKVLDKGGEVTDEEQTEIRKQVITELSDPYKRAVELGLFYLQQDEPNEATPQFRKVLDAYLAKAEGLAWDDELSRWARIAQSYLFEFTLRAKDWDAAEKMIALARQYDFDQNSGDYFRARFDAAKEDYESALQAIERCVKRRPVSSQVVALRGEIKDALGRKQEAIADFKQAAQFNPLDSNISKRVAIALYLRNADLGGNVTTDQFLETKEAIERAIATNKNDIQLLGFYAEFISDSEPENALAIRKRLLLISPTIGNAVLLGNMAHRLSEKKADMNEKQALIELASSSYEQALKLDPSNQRALASYAQFCRDTGRPDEAEQIIAASQDENLQWRYYLAGGQYEKAKNIMDRLYVEEPENESLLAGLIEIAQETGNQDDTRKYSEALRKVEDNVRNNMVQIQAYLSVGLISEAELKLESFREKYPDEPIGKLLNASLLMKQGKLEEALELTNKGLETDQANARGWLLRGQINRLLGNSSQAINDLMKSKSYDDSADVRIALAQTYMIAGRASDAVMELSTIIEDPATPQQARLLMEIIYSYTDNPRVLDSFYGRMINLFPNDMLWVMKAGGFAEKVGNYEAAQRLYLKAWETGLNQGKPNSVALDSYIASLARGGKLQQALDVCAKYVDTEFGTVALVGMAMVKAQMNDIASATEHFRMAADRAQNDRDVLTSILSMMYRVAGPAETEKYCNQKLVENPDSLVTNYVLYNVAREAGQYNKALTFLNKCISICGSETEDYVNLLTDKSKLLTIAYQIYSDNQYRQEAIIAWQQLLEKRPDSAKVLNNLAYLLSIDENRLPEALEYAQKANEKSPDDPDITDTYAYVLYKNSRFEKAAENVRAALQQYELRQAQAPAEVYEHLGMIMSALGQKDEAIGAYQMVLELGKDSLTDEKKEQINEAIRKLGD